MSFKQLGETLSYSTKSATTVSLIMPMFNEAVDLPDVLASLDAQRFPHSAIYLIIIDGGSTDGSVETAIEWFGSTAIEGKIVQNPRRTIPTSLNLGIAQARPGDIVVRLDAHTTYDPDYVAMIVDAFESHPESVACVGGAQIPATERSFTRSLVAALYLNPMGLGGAGFRRATEAMLVSAVYLGAWRPGVLNHLRGYDERWEANEDGEMAARLGHAGFQTLWIPLKSAYRVKRGPLQAIQQWAKYGFWRAQTLRRHPDAFRLRHIAPPLALLSASVLAITPFRLALAVFAIAYISAVYANRSRNESPAVTLASALFFPACQVAWTLGLLRGLVATPQRNHTIQSVHRS